MEGIPYVTWSQSKLIEVLITIFWLQWSLEKRFTWEIFTNSFDHNANTFARTINAHIRKTVLASLLITVKLAGMLLLGLGRKSDCIVAQFIFVYHKYSDDCRDLEHSELCRSAKGKAKGSFQSLVFKMMQEQCLKYGLWLIGCHRSIKSSITDVWIVHLLSTAFYWVVATS